VTEESAGSLLLGIILIRASYKTLLYALQSVQYTSNGTPWTVVPGMHEAHYSSIPLLVFNNNLTLLRCGYMCAGTLVHISRHLGRTSNNNKRCQLYILFLVCFHRVLHQISSITTYILLPLVLHQSPALIMLCYACSLLDITSYLSTTPVCMCSRHDFNHVYIWDLSIHVCLSLHAI